MANRVEFTTTEYEWAHGKKPRGFGYWAFFFDREEEPLVSCASYSQAKKMALAYAVTKGHSVVRVGS